LPHWFSADAASAVGAEQISNLDVFVARRARAPAGSIFATLLISFMEFRIHKLSLLPNIYVTAMQKYIFP
jgi:hypothetical protein